MSDPPADWPSHDVRKALLDQFRPEVVYDSREAFHAASVSEMLDEPNVELRRKDGSVIASPGPGDGALNTEFFTVDGYANRESYMEGDHIAFPARHDYRTQAREMEQSRPELANVVYGHFAQDSSAEHRFWLQYWFFMLYNDAQLLGRFGLHEGDWEMVQFRLVGAGPDWSAPAIDLAVYAQHTYAEARELTPYSQEAQVAFSALGSHAHYFERGVFKTEGLWDVADGGGERVRQTLVYLDQNPPGWLSWPGMWGGTLPSIPDIEDSSPTGPSRHGQWRDPASLLAKARPATPAKPAQIKPVRIRRVSSNYARIDFDFEDIDQPAAFPGSIVTTITAAASDATTSESLVVAVDKLLGGSITPRYAARSEHRLRDQRYLGRRHRPEVRAEHSGVAAAADERHTGRAMDPLPAALAAATGHDADAVGRYSVVARVHVLERLREALDRLDEVIAVGLLLERDPDRGDLAGQVIVVGQRSRVDLAVALDLRTVPFGLAVLRQQDQRRGVRGLGREREVQQDERVGIPAVGERDPVQDDPDEDEDRLRGEVAAGAEEPCQPLGEASERVGIVNRAARRPAGGL